jgi:RimJ/RimL family protein N-acetyltransferase
VSHDRTAQAGSDQVYPGALDVPDRLAGARVLIRPFERGDVEALQEAVAESRENHLLPWLPWARGHTTREETLDFIARSRAQWLTRDSLGGGIFRKEDGWLLGGIGLHTHDWRVRAFEIGYWLRRSAIGQGYMREAVAVMTRVAFEALGANRVMIRCDAHNDRSRRVAEGCGFVFEGRHRHDSLTLNGTLRDTLFFSLVREEYEAQLAQWRPLLGDA